MNTDDTPTNEQLATRVDELERLLANIGFAAAHDDAGADADADADAEIDCGIRELPPREMGPDVSFERESLIRYNARKWVNETVIRYYFFRDGPYRGTKKQIDLVEKGFDEWRDVGIGIEFERVTSIDDAEVRIGFLRGDGYWSYVGTDVLNIGQHERTMNFGNDLSRDRREHHVAVHEIGHTLGFPHEHQNPNAGIVWDEAAVISRFSGPPNNWDEDRIRHNILRKIPSDQVDGSEWDPDSVMHYGFPPGLIKVPAKYRTQPLTPALGLSDKDKQQALRFYPKPEPKHPTLKPFELARLDLTPGQQADFVIKPKSTRAYTLQTFGDTDSVMVLFEQSGGTNVYVAGDDDSGWNRNARIQTRLYADRTYVVRLRLYYRWASGEMALMLW